MPIKTTTSHTKPSVHATISQEASDILEEFANSEEYKNKSAVVDAALKALKKLKEPMLEEWQSVWLRARDELNMIILGKTTFLSYLKGDFKVAYKNNQITPEPLRTIDDDSEQNLSLIRALFKTRSS